MSSTVKLDATVGDFDGDGSFDLALFEAVQSRQDGKVLSSSVYVFLNALDRGDLSLIDADWTFAGNDALGTITDITAGRAQDINGDGFDDMLFAASQADTFSGGINTDAGRAFILYGGSDASAFLARLHGKTVRTLTNRSVPGSGDFVVNLAEGRPWTQTGQLGGSIRSAFLGSACFLISEDLELTLWLDGDASAVVVPGSPKARMLWEFVADFNSAISQSEIAAFVEAFDDEGHLGLRIVPNLAQPHDLRLTFARDLLRGETSKVGSVLGFRYGESVSTSTEQWYKFTTLGDGLPGNFLSVSPSAESNRQLLPIDSGVFDDAGELRQPQVISVGGMPFDSALRFDDSVAVLPGSLLDGKSDFTFETWIRTEQIQRQYLLSGANSSSSNFPRIYFDEGYNSITITLGTTAAIYFPRPINDGQWHHVALVRDTIQSAFLLYMDGEYIDKAVVGGSAVLSMQSIVIGQEQDQIEGGYDSAQSLNADLADIRFWSTARNSAEIANNYRHRLSGTESGLEADYRLTNEASRNIVTTWDHDQDYFASGQGAEVHLSEEEPDRNFGNDAMVFRYEAGIHSNYNFVRFDLSAVDSLETLGSARLQFYDFRYDEPAIERSQGVRFRVWGIDSISNPLWIEGDGGADNNPAGEVTWNNGPPGHSDDGLAFDNGDLDPNLATNLGEFTFTYVEPYNTGPWSAEIDLGHSLVDFIRANAGNTLTLAIELADANSRVLRWGTKELTQRSLTNSTPVTAGSLAPKLILEQAELISVTGGNHARLGDQTQRVPSVAGEEVRNARPAPVVSVLNEPVGVFEFDLSSLADTADEPERLIQAAIANFQYSATPVAFPASVQLQGAVSVGNFVYFAGDGDLWRTDGTAAGTQRITRDGFSFELQQILAVAANDLYFSGSRAGQDVGLERIAGADQYQLNEPTPIAVATPIDFSGAMQSVVIGNDVFLSAGTGLFRIAPGLGLAQPVLNGGSALVNTSASPWALTVSRYGLGESLFLFADGTSGTSLFRVDSDLTVTELGTSLLSPEKLTAVFDRDASVDENVVPQLYLTQQNATQLWVSGPTPGSLLQVISTAAQFSALTNARGMLLLLDGSTLKVTTGSAASTVEVKTVNLASLLSPSGFTEFGGSVFFSAKQSGITGNRIGTELYRFDPDSGAAHMVADIAPGVAN
ncbi:MAG: hypothetical protein KDB00_29445, partial [Planctomycetales bacterium]|nr:hypothetical protein [Planctomycetales bacterium]